MPRYYHVTKRSKVRDIQIRGLEPSTAMGSGGMSSDSGSSYAYTKQDVGNIYLWTDVDYTDGFKTEGQEYAMLVVELDHAFDEANVQLTPAAIREGKTKSSVTSVVCTQRIPVRNIFYYQTEADYQAEKDSALPINKLKPLSAWGQFDIGIDKRDERIWEGRV